VSIDSNQFGAGAAILCLQGNTGRVGIGTTTPEEILHIAAESISTPIGIVIENTYSGLPSKWTIGSGPVGSFRLIDDFAGPADRFIINSSGQVGIGITDLGSMLQVNGNAVIGYSSREFAPTNGLLVAGQVGIGTKIPTDALHVTVSSVTSTGIVLENTYGGGPAKWTIGSGPGHSFHLIDNFASERFTIDSLGQIGIGTTTPDATLDVNGACTFRGSSFWDNGNASFTIDNSGGGECELFATEADMVLNANGIVRTGVNFQVGGTFHSTEAATFDSAIYLSAVSSTNYITGWGPVILQSPDTSIMLGVNLNDVDIWASSGKLYVHGDTKISALSGSGTRLVKADNGGTLSKSDSQTSDLTNWSSSSNPQGFALINNNIVNYKVVDGVCHLWYHISGNSSAGTPGTLFSFTLPVAVSGAITGNVTQLIGDIYNNSHKTTPGQIVLSSSTANLYSDCARGTWSSALSKVAVGYVCYPV
jgi:hypothetical protein